MQSYCVHSQVLLYLDLFYCMSASHSQNVIVVLSYHLQFLSLGYQIGCIYLDLNLLFFIGYGWLFLNKV